MFEANGEFLRQIGCRGDDPGQLMYPYGIAVDPEDNLYVCDLGNHRIQVNKNFVQLFSKLHASSSIGIIINTRLSAV